MTSHCVFWRPIILKNVRGRDFVSHAADIIADYYRGALISEIQKMPKKCPISFEEAVRLVHAEQIKAWGNAEKYISYFACFVQYISEFGFHIELTGDEFEVVLKETASC